MIRNPILPGFNPDPSICRVGEDYYIATSTFEWYPGVQIHHSRDLVNWTLVRRPLERKSQLDMRGNPDSCGIWAPCLSHADGLFWLVYTDVKRLDGNFKDAHNYIVTSPTIEGDWSDPVYVNSSGFDPSLFHDDDGRKWFLNMQWNHRTESYGGAPKHPAFDGILLQCDDVLSSLQLRCKPTTIRPVHTRRMGFIDHQKGIVAIRDLREIGQRSDIAIHGIETFNDNPGMPLAAFLSPKPDCVFERRSFIMCNTSNIGATCPHAVVRTGVDQHVMKDQIARLRKRGQDGDIGTEATTKVQHPL